MIQATIQYGALTAKVRALYGKRLKKEDYDKMLAMKSVSELAGYLNSHPGWSNSMAGLVTQGVRRVTLESALHMQYLNEYERIFYFIARKDKQLMRFPIYKMELETILTAIRRLYSTHTMDLHLNVSDFYKRQSKINFDLLNSCTSFSQLVSAIENSVYYKPLRQFSSVSETNYTAVEIILQSTYFSLLQKAMNSGYKGRVKKSLINSLSMDMDLLSIIHLLRLKRYFPDSGPQIFSTAFAFRYKLKPELIRRLIEAPDYDAAYSVLLASPYRKSFAIEHPAGLEELYYMAKYRFNKRLLRTGEPSIYTAIAYLNLKEIELLNLINIIECVRYGIDPAQSKIPLIGLQAG